MPASRALSDKNWRARSNSPPKVIEASLSPANIKRGLVARLPNLKAVDRASSLLAKQPHVNDGVGGHPVIIVDVQNGGNTVTACSCTAWHDPVTNRARRIQDKYPSNGHGCRYQYLAVEHKGTTQPHNDLPVLRMENNGQFPDQTFVHVAQYFQIETKNLQPASFIGKGSLVLTDNSLGQLIRHLIDFSEGKMPIYSTPGFPTARSTNYMPVLSADCRSLAWRASFVKLPTPPATSLHRLTGGVYVAPAKRKAGNMSSGAASLPSAARPKKAPRRSLELRVVS